MNLSQALRLNPPPHFHGSTPLGGLRQASAGIAFVGAGGKSTAMFQLARELSSEVGLPVVVTATSHLHVDQIKLADSHWIGVAPEMLSPLEDNLRGVMLVTGPIESDRTLGLDEESIDWLHAVCGYYDIPLLIEADGSRRHPLKAPAEHEPPLPTFVDTVVVVAGLSGLGKPLIDESVHRPEIFSHLSGLPLGAEITPEALLRVLTHPAGGLKNIPSHARRIALLTQADTTEALASAQWLAERLVPPFDAALIASLLSEPLIRQVVEPIAGIILAAGEASRFGAPKQLLDYHGEPFVSRVARTALAAGLSPVVVVTGANAVPIEAALAGPNVHIARNDDWQSGQSSSIRLGLQSLPEQFWRCCLPPGRPAAGDYRCHPCPDGAALAVPLTCDRSAGGRSTRQPGFVRPADLSGFDVPLR